MLTKEASFQNGIDVLLADKRALLRNKNIALVTNDVAKTNEGIPTRYALQQQGFMLKKLFGPEHGLQATGADGAFQAHGKDGLTGLPIVSLYSEKLMPSESDLSDVDVVLYDIPDVGCRFYTYLWTLTYVMETCVQYGKELVILDRPNPIGGDLSKAEGPFLDETCCSSFIGRWRMPIRHSCSIGELARYFAATRMPSLQLDVIACRGWNRMQDMQDAQLEFAPTSPAIRDLETALLYPGTCFWEGINVQEGRGTEYAFKQMGAPWISGEALCEALNQYGLEGIAFEAVDFVPQSGRFVGIRCAGLRCSITDKEIFRPVHSGIVLLKTLATLYPQHITEATYPTRANPSGSGHLDRLLGFPNSFEQMLSQKHVDTTIPLWQQETAAHLLY